MTSPLLLVAITLFAVLVGATLPVLYQLYQTLKRARAVLDTAGPNLERTLGRVGQAAERIDRLAAHLEGPARSLGPVLAAATTVGDSIGSSGSWLRTAASIGGALAPAVIAGVSALFLRTELRSGDAREHAAGH
jgi:hypothetical protein